jgi:hypothetical protein
LYQLPTSHSPYLDRRLETDSSFFIDKPYLLGALGEGQNALIDKSPLYRTDDFDCVTYVSTVLALVESNNIAQFNKNQLKINYENAIPDYVHRNHFMSVDWNPNNEKNGYLKDVTKTLFPNTYKIAVATIDKPNWYRNLAANNIKDFQSITPQQTQDLLQQLHDLSEKTRAEISRLPYIPLTTLYDKNGKPNMALFDRIPSDVVIEIVRPNWNIRKLIGTNMNISHLGLGIREKGVLIFREASSLENKVIDIPLTEYLANYLDSSSVKGIHIEKIVLKKEKEK